MKNTDNCIYGYCSECGYPLVPIWFREIEYDESYSGYPYETGRTRLAVDYLLCERCGHKECVDDSFDGKWH